MAGDPRRVTGLFVTGTDTGVGKSVVSACLVAALRARGERVAAVKPVLTGLDEPPAPGEWPMDHELLAGAAGTSPDAVTAFTFGPAVSPHLAAELAGTPLDAAAVIEETRSRAATGDVAIVEGVGGLLVPIAPGLSVRDLAVALGLPLVVVARPGLGTINHTLLTLESARAAGLDVRAVVLNPWPDEPTVMERSNRETIERLGEVEVQTLGETSQDRLAPSGSPLVDAIYP
ncbi:MAG: Dethiobiotin synthetase [uncultured Solirubrobacteraceae bacterium]|uniref:ATP-dependent dethiobiotin synthetase BioD n=1 Tax=uncultured Solirubrobacteraceae bacterium TaxID=1162706 RepID=A0A6J4SWU9_9ACTN|nr:MAG: Dethiobiotin synthetase [uncultured Solirubrobacteraceae bacterium]